MIDLHCGQDAQGPTADLVSRDTGLLSRVWRPACAELGADRAGRLLRPVRLPSPGNADDDSPGLTARTVLQPEVWDRSELCYAAIEVYLPTPNHLDDGSLELARWLVRTTAHCAGG